MMLSIKEHTVQDKVPVVTDKYLDANSDYPQDGIIACEIVKKWKDMHGKIICTVNTAKPWGIDSIDGLTEFTVWEEQLIEFTW